MDALLKAKNELLAIDAQMLALDVTAESFDVENWNKLKTSKEVLIRQIEQLEIKLAAEQAAEDHTKRANTPAKPRTQDSDDDANQNPSNVYGVKQSTDDTLGFVCAGELLAEAIHFAHSGTVLPGEDFEHRSKRFENYLQNTDSIDIQQASGTASTLDDGIEIIPTLLGGIKERGPGTFNPVLQMFNPVKSARKEVDFYINEDVYNIDGLVVQRVDEGGTLTAQKFTNKLERMRLYKVGVFAQITEEDLQNVPLLQSRYMDRAPTVIGIQKVTDIINGSGVTTPVGFITAGNGARILSARVGANLIEFADLANMEKRYWRGGGGGNGVYFTNQSTLGQLMSLADDSGALIWKPNRNDGILGGPIFGTLFGRPLIVSEDMPALGTAGDLSLVNVEGYLFAEHTSGIRFAESLHFLFDTDKKAMRWLNTYGGRPYFTKAYSPREGGEDLSHFVLLDA